MDVTTVVAPSVEPLTADELKTHLRVTSSDEDTLIASIISAARVRAESLLRHRLITQTVELTMTGFPSYIEIPVWPVVSVASVKYDDGDGVEQTVSSADYLLVKRRPRVIAPKSTATWPTPGIESDSVRVRCIVGYGDAGSNVPADILAAIRLIAGDLWEHRENTVIGAPVASIPTPAEALLAPHVLYV